MRTGAISVAVLSATLFVSVMQYRHHKGYDLKNKPPVIRAQPVAQPEPAGIVWIFGHAYPSEQVSIWFERIEGKYCVYGDQIYAASSAPGEPMSYPHFVWALQQGFYFPELAGVGVRSDGEQKILSQTHAYQIKQSRPAPRYRRLRN